MLATTQALNSTGFFTTVPSGSVPEASIGASLPGHFARQRPTGS